MHSLSMEPLKVYRATTESSDKTIRIGQVMWVSKNGHLNLPNEYGGGWLSEEEWHSLETVDFEVEPTKGMVQVTGDHERLIV